MLASCRGFVVKAAMRRSVTIVGFVSLGSLEHLNLCATMPATSTAAESAFLSLRPSYKNKPTTTKMKQIIAAVLTEKLENITYQSDKASQVTKEIADAVKLQLKACEFPRCKYLVQVVIGEQRGEGVRMGCRCFWDSETDCYATETYTNESLFCVATAFSVYLY
ncbi:hypothetical protein AeMF1_001813 [Aphanomyces euteiches]|nr:hypothetical protein AeMF1_001813 [Aphanomyces euteiches]KAH9189995.1 hypothetical protein AeNC1_008032 [Aphanomyces euteiches]